MLISLEVQSSPTKPCGKGSKRKQDDVDDDEEDVEEQSWVEALNQELADEDAADPEDPDYEVGVCGPGVWVCFKKN